MSTNTISTIEGKHTRLTAALMLIALVMAGIEFSTAHATPLQQSSMGAIQGRVIDATDGAPLPGVNIAVKHTTIGTATNVDGSFGLDVPSLNDTLVFSFIGYHRQEVPINGRSQIRVEMQSEVLSVDELVVTAFGIKRQRESLAYSTSQVQGEDLAQIPENNVALSLNGKVAGVDVTAPATGPGGSSRIIIRGAGSLNGNNQPLYVVDGMPIDNTIHGSVTGTNTFGHHIDRGDGIGGINADDIESLTVLKGGPAAALYGSRASNGVILITTKRGRGQDGIGVEFSSSSTFSNVNIIPDWQYEYGQGYSDGKPQTQADAVSSGRLSWGDRMDGTHVMQFDGQMRPYSPQKDNVKNFFETGTNFKNSLAFTGGSETLSYRFSASNTRSDLILPNSNFEKNIIGGNVNASVGKRLRVAASGQYNIDTGTNRPKTGYADKSAFWGLYMAANTVDIRNMSPGYDENGKEIAWNSVPVATNPYFVVNKFSTSDKRNRFIGQVDLIYDLTDKLFLQTKVSEDYSRIEYEGIEPDGNNFRPKGNYEASEGVVSENNAMLTLNYQDKVFRRFDITGMLGGNRQRNLYDQTDISGSEFNIPGFYSFTNLASTSTGLVYRSSGTNSVFGSADIGYNDVVFLSLTGRQDWFSTLNAENNGIFYPSIGGSLVLSKALNMPSSLDYLKLRGSWAQVGGSSVSPYIINQTYTMREGGHNGRPVQTVASNLVPNPNLRPLTSTSYEVGVDAQLFDYLVTMDVTFYNRTTTDDIVRSNIASSSGYTSALLNVGEVNNKGIELLVNTTPVRGRFTWDLSYNMAYNKSEVIRLAEGLNTLSIGRGIGGGTIQHVVGRPYGAIWGFEKETNEAGQTVFSSRSGYALRSDPKELGLGIHPLMMGLTNTVRFGNLALNVQVDGKFGGSVYSNFYQYAYRFGLIKATLPGRDSGLTVEGVDENGDPFTKMWEVSELDTYYDNDKRYTSMFVFDNSFVKLRQVALTYRLPTEMVSRFVNIQSASVSLVGRNLAILFKDKDQNYFDPESSYTTGNAQGLNAFGMPGTRTIGIDFKVNL